MESTRVGLGRRLSALTIDWLMCLVVAGALLPHGNGMRQFGPLIVFFLEVSILLTLQGASAGQRIVRLKVVRYVDGGSPTPLQALIRTTLLCLVVTAVTFDHEGRGIHERMSGTVLRRY